MPTDRKAIIKRIEVKPKYPPEPLWTIRDVLVILFFISVCVLLHLINTLLPRGW